MASAAAGRRSPVHDRPNMSDLRIVLLGKNEKENRRVGNTILDTTAFYIEAASYSQQHTEGISVKVEETKITVINTHLLKPNFPQYQIIEAVSECVSQSAPGPHVIVLVLQYKDFSENDRQRVKTVLNLFSEQAMKHTIVLTTDEQTRGFIFTSRNNAIHDLIKECGGGHLKINTVSTGWCSELFRRIEKILKKEREEFLICGMFEDEGGTQVDKDQSRSGASDRGDDKEKKDSDLKESTKTASDGGDLREREDELRIVLLGKPGAGKSSTGNTILARKVFKSETSHMSVTRVCQRETSEINSRHITVIDTPGLFDTELSNEETQREISNCIPMILPGPHVFIIVLSLGQRFTQEEATAVEIIQKTFGENSLMFTMVLFTKGDYLNDKPIEQCLGKPGSALNQLIEACGNRYHVFNNKETGDRTQVTDLLQKIDNMVKENRGSYYSCKMFREMEREIQEQQKKILMEKVEQVIREREELMNKHKEEKKRMRMKMEEDHEKERNRREEEFIEREERYKIDIIEREEQERKIREELKREREEWEKQKQQEKQRREEEEKKWRKKEQAILEEYNQRLKQEKERMKMMMEEERQNHYKERKRIEEEFIEREERYKRDIKEREEQERKIREEMKREREEWEKQKQQERQRKEEEKERCRFIELYTGTPEIQHTNSDEDSPSDSGGLRILLFGRTGSGKSSTGNTILGNRRFQIRHSSQLVTTVCQKTVGEVDGRSVAVIDTPGLFDPSLTKEKVQEEIMKSISLSAPGPHAFIIVLSVGRITPEEKDTLDMIKIIFGSKAADFCIVLFTRGHILRGQTIEQYVQKNAELKKLISDCGNRFLAFNNTNPHDPTQVPDLLNMIEEMNHGQYFTNEMFEEAVISIEQRMEMIEENERKNQAQVEELKAKYDREDMSMRMRLKERKQKTDEEKKRLKNKFREREETLRREFEEKEKSDQKKQETEDQKQSEEEKQQRDEYNQRKEKMKREIEHQRIQYEKQQNEREEEDGMREQEYKQDQEKMKNDHQHIMTELGKKQEEEIKKRDSEEQMRKTQEEKEREKWRRKIKEAENDKETQGEIKQQQREWEEEKKRQMREREKEERERRERHKKQLREKQEELEKIRKKLETKREEEEQMIEEEREKLKREREKNKKDYEEKLNEMERRYEQLERERKEEWKRRKQEDEERRVEKRKRWEKMMEDIKRDQEEEIKRRKREERERINREEKECDEMKQKHEEEIEKMKKHEDEARKQQEEQNNLRKRKEQHIQDLKERLEQLNEMKKLRKELQEKCHVM